MRLGGRQVEGGGGGGGRRGAEEEKRHNESLRGSRGIESGEKRRRRMKEKDKKGEWTAIERGEKGEKGDWKGRKRIERGELNRKEDEKAEGGWWNSITRWGREGAGWGVVGKQEGSCYSGQQVTGSAGGQVRGGQVGSCLSGIYGKMW